MTEGLALVTFLYIFCTLLPRILSTQMSPVALASSPAPAQLTPKTNGSTAMSKRPIEVQNLPVRTSFAFDPIEDALAAFGRGEFLVVMDDEDRENEGDLIIAGSMCTTEKMAWMIKHTR